MNTSTTQEGGPPAREAALSSNQYTQPNTAYAPSNQDLFALARDIYTISDIWSAFQFEGVPSKTCTSPFRGDRIPSLSVFDNGKAWFDHSTGDGGDVIEFIRNSLGGDHKDVREWLRKRIEIDRMDYGSQSSPRPFAKTPEGPKLIEWPAELVEGNNETWDEFAKLRRLTYSATWVLVQSGILRFCKIEGITCFVVTDDSKRAAEIRRLDGTPFGESKTYQLRGVDKSWLPGVDLLRDATKETGILMTAGATDLLSAIDIYSRYRRNCGGTVLWQPVALLGAQCRSLHSEASPLIRGRRVRLVPDADPAGDGMTEHWTGLLRKTGCEVDVVTLPRGTDLSDNLSTISPTDLFSR